MYSSKATRLGLSGLRLQLGDTCSVGSRPMLFRSAPRQRYALAPMLAGFPLQEKLSLILIENLGLRQSDHSTGDL